MPSYAELKSRADAEYAKFDAEKWIGHKLVLINDWFRDQGLDSVVIGISGGIDSAVCYKLMEMAAAQFGSPIKKIVPLSIPIFSSTGTTGQRAAVELAEVLVPGIRVVHVGDASNSMFGSLTEGGSYRSTFAKGQLDYWLRPAILYGQAALLQAEGHKSVVCGTINKCESFLGFYGKHTDVCDFCPIIDLTKSQVYKVAVALGVPQEIISAVPSGGVHTGESDEELIGASYDDIETFMYGYESWLYFWGEMEDAPDSFNAIFKHREKNNYKFLRGPDTVKL